MGLDALSSANADDLTAFLNDLRRHYEPGRSEFRLYRENPPVRQILDVFSVRYNVWPLISVNGRPLQ